jgi:hypothetical protein
VKNPDKVLLPSRDLILIALGEDESMESIPFALLDDLSLDSVHRSVIEVSVSGLLGVGVFGLTHSVRSPIASRTD